ncbi:hypothetical protein EVAR_29846_1 [Eumeta japonica]|uniref:Uncharacterized protein n=1 Tax=Eumeta variegata TaxID=151549 RepID=A0A4C1VT15_EUMVA|nr:hypothetical protein EVAR_29846_1 [Eumeta japonica]
MLRRHGFDRNVRQWPLARARAARAPSGPPVNKTFMERGGLLEKNATKLDGCGQPSDSRPRSDAQLSHDLLLRRQALLKFVSIVD